MNQTRGCTLFHADAQTHLSLRWVHEKLYYVPNFEEVERAYCFGPVRPLHLDTVKNS